MLVIKELNTIFIGLPYSASSALIKHFKDNYTCTELFHKHSNYSSFALLLKFRYPNHRVLAVYRDPLEIMYSRFSKMKLNKDGRFTLKNFSSKKGGYVSRKSNKLTKKILRNDLTFDEFMATNIRMRLYTPYYNEYILNLPYITHELSFDDLDKDLDLWIKSVGAFDQRRVPLSIINSTEKGILEVDSPVNLNFFAHFYRYKKRYTKGSIAKYSGRFVVHPIFLLLRIRFIARDWLKLLRLSKLKGLNRYG